jgi:hypothetical protein
MDHDHWFKTLIREFFVDFYVGLPGLDAIEYLQGDSWLGVALSALMRIPHERVAWLGAEALRRSAAERSAAVSAGRMCAGLSAGR